MFSVTQEQLCRKLLIQRQEGIRFFTFMGPRYFVSKAVLIGMTIFLFWLDDPMLDAAALIGCGYLAGMILAHLRTFIILKKSWPIHRELIDWEKVEGSRG